MPSFTFIEPSNDHVENVSAEQVVGFMRQNGEFWGPYSPVGQVLWDGPEPCQLFFVRHPRRGWYVEHYVTRERHLVAFDPAGDRNAWVEAWAEGDTSFFLAACFLSQGVAERIVTDFFATRQPSPAAAWEPVHWDVHRREGPPDDETLVVEDAE